MLNLLAALLLITLFKSEVFAQDELPGPIRIRNQFPLHSVHLSLSPQEAEVVDYQTAELSLGSGWTNSFVLADSYLVDAESVDFRGAARWGAWKGGELSIELPLLWRGGGRLDSLIDDWHRVWGFPRGERGKVPSNDYDISGLRNDGQSFSIQDAGLSIGNPVLGFKAQLYEADGVVLSSLFEYSAPRIGGYGHEGSEGLIGLIGTQPLGRYRFHQGVSLNLKEDGEYRNLNFKRAHGEAFLSIERGLIDNLSICTSIYLGSKTVTGVTGYPEFFTYLDVGVSWRIAGDTLVSFLLRENPFPHDGTADVSFFGSWSVSLR